MTRMTIYHGYEWSCLVEQGWHTMYVDNVSGIAVATMLYQPPIYRWWQP
jgi:hypothetical protein